MRQKGFAPEAGQLERVSKKLLDLHEGEEIRFTNCLQNGCFDSCVLKCHVKDGKLLSVTTDNSIHVNAGREDEYCDFGDFEEGLFQKRSCVRGRGWKGEVNNYNGGRILYPMKRIGERGSGQWERISWDEALDTIATKYKETREKYGPFSIYTDGILLAGYDEFAPWMEGGGIGCWGADSYEPNEFADTNVFGDFKQYSMRFDSGAEGMTLFDAKSIVLWGFDWALNYTEYIFYMLLARDKGIPMIMIEPRFTWSTQAADQWIPIRPGTDNAVMEAMSYYLIKNGRENKKFVKKWIEPTGYAKWVDYLNGKGEDGVVKTPEWAAEISGIPAETIEALADFIVDNSPCFFRQIWAASRVLRGENISRTYDMFLALTGNIGQHGNVGSGTDIGKGYRMLPPFVFRDMGTIKGEEKCYPCIEQEQWHNAILLREKLDAGEITEEFYKAEIGCAPYYEAPNIKFLFLVISPRNIIPNFYGSNRRLEAVKKAEFVAYAAWNWSMTSAHYADIILPMAHTCMERGGNTDFAPNTNAIVVNTFTPVTKIVDPPGECRPRLWINKQIANRLGLKDVYMTRFNDCDTLEEWYERYAEISADSYKKWQNAPLPMFGGTYETPDWETFLEEGILRIPVQKGRYHRGAISENLDLDIPLPTPSGKMEFFQDFFDEEDISQKVQYGSKCYGHGRVDPMSVWGIYPNSYFNAERIKDYPLHMITPHSFYKQHFVGDLNPLYEDEYRRSIWLSVSDAKARGIKDGDMVMAYSDVGQCLVPAYVTNRLVPGLVCLPFGRNYMPSDVKTELMPDGIDLAGSCNFLISDNHYDCRRGALLCTSLIEVVKASQARNSGIVPRIVGVD